MSSGELRIGIVGAGQIARSRHLPGFRAMPGVRVVAVCNQRRETAARVARDFQIPKIFDSWEHIVEDPEVDAVVIGTWPYMHCPITLEAFSAGKHVLTQARMAMNARESQRMLDAAIEHPKLVAMVVPSPFGLTGDAYMRSLLADGYIGTLREVHVKSMTSDLADPKSSIGWRQMTRYSGFNMLTLGMLYETLIRWVPPAQRVMAFATKLIPLRPDPETGKLVRVGTPDSVQVLTIHEDGSNGLYRLSGVVHHALGHSIALFGSRGSLVYDLSRDEIHGAARGEDLRMMPIPPQLRGGWQVEADFVDAIRGERSVTLTDFATGVRYMQFTEAVARSSRHQQPVTLPLKEFSNPSL